MSCKPTVWVPLCDNPHCQGWVHDVRGVIQMCDDCKRYCSDSSASRAHRKFRHRCQWCNEIAVTEQEQEKEKGKVEVQ